MTKAGESVNDRLKFYGLSAQDTDYGTIRDKITGLVDQALTRFYAKVKITPKTARFFSNDKEIEGAKQAQTRHWLGLFGGGVTEDYVASANRIGLAHARIGLEVKWYIGAYASILEDMMQSMLCGRFSRFIPGRRTRVRQLTKFVKLSLLDMDIAVSSYFDAEDKTRMEVADKIGAALDRLSHGDLTTEMHDLPTAYVQIQSDFNNAIAQLRKTLAGVNESTDNIATGASEIRAASNDLASRTQHQASTVGESAAAMAALTDAATETSRELEHLSGKASNVYGDASRGAEVVKRAIEGMREIQESANNIAQIIAMIDGIAFQTNLLALNAGVEAARVGDLGKGFAVVANEVRALAQRSSEAAENIKGLVSDSVSRIETGAGLVDEAGSQLDSIMRQMGEMSDAAARIAETTNGQTSHLRQVSESMRTMDVITQQNAAMVEESNAASQHMASQTELLKSLIAAFQLDGHKAAKPVDQRYAA